MVRTFSLVALAACGGPDDPPPGRAPPSAAPDPIAAAYGNCTDQGDEVDDDLGPLSTRTHRYDENGDPERSEADYFDDDTFYDWTIRYRVGDPHQITRSVTTYTRTDGWTHEYTWEDGHVVRDEWDDASDGTVDEIGVFVFDGDQMTRWEWDYDADGTVDDFADYVWTPDGDGWSVVADGVDPNGPYHTEEWRDAELRQVEYHYEDSTGLVADWVVESYSALDLPGTTSTTHQLDGLVILEEDDERTFDEVGRLAEEIHYKAEFDADGMIGSFTRTIAWSYDCP